SIWACDLPPASIPRTCTPGFAAPWNCSARATAAPQAATSRTRTRTTARFIPTVKQRRRACRRFAVAYCFDVELRDLPSVDELARGLDDPLATDAARTVLARARAEIRAGGDPGDLAARLHEELAEARRPALSRVLNAAGVIVHTNLGRAPLPAAALERALEVGRGYSNLEYDLASGARGSRQDPVAAILRRATGPRAAVR